MTSILYQERSNGVGSLTMNRPDVRNALNWEAMDRFAEAVERAHASPTLRALVLTGAGRSFCSGGDLTELHEYPSREDGLRLASGMGEALRRLETLPVPTIAALEGPALGGGAEIALACDLRLMAQDATLGMMHIRLGISPAWGSGQRLLRLVGYALALEWLAAGRVLDAREALQHGLVHQLVPSGGALDLALERAESFARQDPGAVRAVKKLLLAGLNLPPDEAAEVERDAFPDLWAAPAHLEASARFVARKAQKKRRVA